MLVKHLLYAAAFKHLKIGRLNRRNRNNQGASALANDKAVNFENVNDFQVMKVSLLL
jgi:hypothetical protein